MRMEDEKDLLKRKFEPFTDYRPVEPGSSGVFGLKGLFNETLGQAQKTREAFEKRLEPYTEEAGVKVKEFAASIEDIALKSSSEARSFIARTLEALAQKIKP
jgi:hypothetical protein